MAKRYRDRNTEEDRVIALVDSLKKKRGIILESEIKRKIDHIAFILVSRYTDFEWIDDTDLTPDTQELRQFAYWHGYLCTRYGMGYTAARYRLSRAISDRKWECYLKDENIHQGDSYSPKQCENIVRNILNSVKYSNNSVFG